jgi:hypothetical protein
VHRFFVWYRHCGVSEILPILLSEDDKKEISISSEPFFPVHVLLLQSIKNWKSFQESFTV